MTAPDPPEAPGAPARSRPVVRLAEAPDLPAVCEIVNHYIEHTAVNFRTAPQTPAEWRELWRERRDRYPWYVAEVAGEPVGIAYAGPWNPRAAYAWTAESTIYLAPDHHGRGLGGALYGRLLRTLAQQGFHSVLAGIVPPNPGSERLHRAQGFMRVGTVRAAGHKRGGWHDVGYWQRTLAPAAQAPPPAGPRPVPR